MVKKILLYISNLWLSCYNVIVRRIGSEIMNKEISILDVAKRLICKFNDDDKEITQLKLQKMLYFIEAYYMVKYNKPSLYKEEFYAWTYGPVCKEIYDKYKYYLNSPIYEECEILPYLDDEIQSSINDVYLLFSKYSTSQLIGITHLDGSPWSNIRKLKDLNLVIPKKETKEWFKEMVLQND